MNTIGGVHYESTIQEVLTSVLRTSRQRAADPLPSGSLLGIPKKQR